ncbi:hypothetical protein IMG5_124450 [Ichthyophthirius multifiliis]|uniref:Uncharacterized protein n=1 Tax=Ichthyophthirius multifiliis TaxID=5932 RepID=G0QVL0_ICHMU|nr:hypothetical protein IMG5_124450 [Ichthyophthirius multifiliis]EGR30733.1 hypothetical protein IMG5_124450 [Ichthyophthirius multifiliis]|eukprot:XP_004032320.1 hypothetical protein IMG5_124450 [Ichthyophthirius multifiliis]
MLPFMTKNKKYQIKIDFYEPQECMKAIKYPPENTGLQGNFSFLKGAFNVPDYVYLPEDFTPKLDVFIENLGWTEEHINLIKYDNQTKHVQFQTKILAPLACILPLDADYPYQSFHMKSFQDQLVSLNLKRINLMPDFENDYKISDVENKALQEVLMLIKCFQIQSNIQNRNIGNDQIIFDIKQNYEFKESEEFQWVQTNIWCNKCSLFDQKNKPLGVSHSMVSQIFQSHQNILENLTQDVIDKMEDVLNADFQNNLRRFLKLSKIVAFS